QQALRHSRPGGENSLRQEKPRKPPTLKIRRQAEVKYFRLFRQGGVVDFAKAGGTTIDVKHQYLDGRGIDERKQVRVKLIAAKKPVMRLADLLVEIAVERDRHLLDPEDCQPWPKRHLHAMSRRRQHFQMRDA